MKSTPQVIFLTLARTQMSLSSVPCWIIDVPDYFKTQEMRIKAAEEGVQSFVYVPDRFKTQEMCNKAMSIEPYFLVCVPDRFKTQKNLR